MNSIYDLLVHEHCTDGTDCILHANILEVDHLTRRRQTTLTRVGMLLTSEFGVAHRLTTFAHTSTCTPLPSLHHFYTTNTLPLYLSKNTEIRNIN